jgi:hypothetical protein
MGKTSSLSRWKTSQRFPAIAILIIAALSMHRYSLRVYPEMGLTRQQAKPKDASNVVTETNQK